MFSFGLQAVFRIQCFFLFLALMMECGCSLEAADEVNGGAKEEASHGHYPSRVESVLTLTKLQHSIENRIAQTKADGQIFYQCDLIRLYVRQFPASGKNDIFLSDLREVKDKLLERGRESLARANAGDQRLVTYYLNSKKSAHSQLLISQMIDSEAKRLAGGDDGLAIKLLEDYANIMSLHLDAALHLGLHCVIFPNSPDSLRQLADAAKSAEIASLPNLELEMRTRRMEQNGDRPSFEKARLLAEKAAAQRRYFIAINVMDRFLDANFNHAMAGLGYIASGDIHQFAGCYELAVSKYKLALLWCRDMEKLIRTEGRENTSFLEDVDAVRQRANLSVGYSILDEAKGKQLQESTAAFAGKLHDKAVAHFDRLAESTDPASSSGLKYLLGQVRSRVELARYKRAHFSDLSMNDLQDAYASCVSPCETYLRLMGQNKLTAEEQALPYDESRDEVAFVLMEVLMVMSKLQEGESQFVRSFIRPGNESGTKWETLAKVKIAKRLVDDGSYLEAYPLLAEVVRDVAKTGLYDLGFGAGLMMGICIAKLNPMDGIVSGHSGIAAGGISRQKVIEAYAKAFAILQLPDVPHTVQYPNEFKTIFLDDIRNQLTAEYRSSLEFLEAGWEPFRRPFSEPLLVDALSRLNPESSPFNPDILMVTAFLQAKRELAGQKVSLQKK